MIVYHGGGFVGLSGAAHFALNGYEAIVYDPDQRVVDTINKGDTNVVGLKEFLDIDLKELVDTGMLKATSRLKDVTDHDVHLLAVPTEANGEPEMRIVTESVRMLAGMLSHGATIIVESTLEPGCAKRLVEACKDAHKSIGSDIFFVVAPRRDWFVSKEMNLVKLARVAGGVTEGCKNKAREILGLVSKNVIITDYEVAEMVKSVENSLLHVPVVYCNQLARVYHDIDISEVIRLAGTHWRIPNYFVSLGVAGYCVPMGTKYLQARSGVTIADAVSGYEDEGREIVADFMRAWAREKGLAPRCAMIGLSYKTGCKVHQFSPVISLAKSLNRSKLFWFRLLISET